MRTDRTEPSPKFTEKPSINAGDSFLIDPDQNARSSKYKPFDAFIIQNNSNQDIEVQFNDQDSNIYLLEANTIAQEEYPDIQEFRKLRIINLGSSDISKGDLKITYYYSGVDADKRASNLAKRSKFSKAVENITGIPLE